MGLEIERKFLLKNSDWRKAADDGIDIKQGYLNSNKERTVRIRIKGKQGILTIKSKTINSTRQEFEYEIPLSDAKELLKLCEQPLIEKRRFEVFDNGKIWEIDEFEGLNKGLVISEVELNSEDEEIVLPNWIGNEVTLDAKYYNSNLIENPFQNW